eukprot:TRINITY_DN66882_c0_g1_i1.p1 TRINITY_DN66882_c0_g1~~TRINITY_DN66882_c0_g1_i1.p1  ORF type:complete len:273 (+),score=29.60 TRINITY_DN66882_c0_g1_i1:48-821(+)
MLRTCRVRLGPSEALARSARATIEALRPGDLLFVEEPRDDLSELNNAIDCVGDSTIKWLEARGRAVARRDTAIHVGMIRTGGRDATAIDAYRGVGVRSLALPLFLSEWSKRCKVYHGRVQGVSVGDAEQAVRFAEEKLGAEYSEAYLPPDDENDAYYCSSLIDYSFQSALKKRLVFTNEPFSLIFEPHEFWEKYYRERHERVPTCVGSNPTLLLHSPCVKYYETVLGPFAASREVGSKYTDAFDVERYLQRVQQFQV